MFDVKGVSSCPLLFVSPLEKDLPFSFYEKWPWMVSILLWTPDRIHFSFWPVSKEGRNTEANILRGTTSREGKRGTCLSIKKEREREKASHRVRKEVVASGSRRLKGTLKSVLSFSFLLVKQSERLFKEEDDQHLFLMVFISFQSFFIQHKTREREDEIAVAKKKDISFHSLRKFNPKLESPRKRLRVQVLLYSSPFFFNSSDFSSSLLISKEGERNRTHSPFLQTHVLPFLFLRETHGLRVDVVSRCPPVLLPASASINGRNMDSLSLSWSFISLPLPSLLVFMLRLQSFFSLPFLGA